ncbi:MAG: hypothetical protein AAB361_03245 [Patescibacteria group bacterium]
MAKGLPSYLFWLDWVKKIVWDSFWWVILMLFVFWVPFLRVWWWFFAPFFLSIQLKILYLWWIEWDYDYQNAKWALLDIVPPREVLAPFKAMEDVFSAVWPIIDVANFREAWCDGELTNGPYWCSWEIASIEGKIHFYVRCREEHRLVIESSLYAHYPDIEVHQVSDYTKLVPPTVPNEDWDMYGEDWDLHRSDIFPIKTYEKFFEPQGEKISAEEKRMDPVIALLEGMSRLGQGEHYWVQFITVPIQDHDEPDWRKEGERVINKISKRSEKRESTLFEDLSYIAKQVIFGPEKEGKGESASYSWAPTQIDEETGEREMAITPGEREIITEIENKLKKPVYRTTIRGVYVARRENWKSPHKVIMRSYMGHFSTINLNHFRFSGKTRPKVHYLWRKRRVFQRARKMFRMTVLRFPPLFPQRMSDDLNPILSTEEMATLFHFPLRVTGMVTPTMVKVESKKSGPPPNLPVDE